jgi:hypothetical protein
MHPGIAQAALLGLLAISIVASFQAIGTLLVFGLLVGPPATAALVVRRIPAIMIVSIGFGALAVIVGLQLSYHHGTAGGATMAGTATCSGEGGMIPDERRYSSKWFYQCIQSRYGFNPHHLQLADACEFFIGQGCKVGLGGHLMGQKVTEQVAEMRSLPAGIDQRSPARHPDWLGPDDLSLKVQETREATNYEIPIQLKLGAARVYDDVRMAAKCGPDIIYLDGAEGSTGAGPHTAAEDRSKQIGKCVYRELFACLGDQLSAQEVVVDELVIGGYVGLADVFHACDVEWCFPEMLDGHSTAEAWRQCRTNESYECPIQHPVLQAHDVQRPRASPSLVREYNAGTSAGGATSQMWTQPALHR